MKHRHLTSRACGGLSGSRWMGTLAPPRVPPVTPRRPGEATVDTRHANPSPSARTVYALLEARLPYAPITPNSALRICCELAPYQIHHIGVVEHLVQVIRGNKVSLDPTLCLALMEQLISPALPRWLCGHDAFESGDLKNSVGSGRFLEQDGSIAGMEHGAVAVRVALAPISSTLVHCVAVHVHMLVAEGDRELSAAEPRRFTELWDMVDGRAAQQLISGKDSMEAFGDASFSPLTSRWAREPRREASQPSDVEDAGKNLCDGQGSFLLRCAAVVLTFTAQLHHWACSDDEPHTKIRERRAAIFDRIDRHWHRRCLHVVALPVVRYLRNERTLQPQKKATLPQESQSASLFLVGDGLPSPHRRGLPRAADESTLPHWSTVRHLGQQCWWWSVLVCRATPVIPSLAEQAFVVRSLVASVEALHHNLALRIPSDATELSQDCSGSRSHEPALPATSQMPFHTDEGTLSCCVMLEWLIVQSTPPLQRQSSGDDRDSVGGVTTRVTASPCKVFCEQHGTSSVSHELCTPRDGWTDRLRYALACLAMDFVRLTEVIWADWPYLAVRPGSPAGDTASAEANTSIVTQRSDHAYWPPASRLTHQLPFPSAPPSDRVARGVRHHLVRSMTAVGYRTAVQWAAATALTRAAASTHAMPWLVQVGCNALLKDSSKQRERRWRDPVIGDSEMIVMQRLLRGIVSLSLTMTPADDGSCVSTQSAATDVFVIVDEDTWCKLACVVHILSTSSCSVEDIAPAQQALLRIACQYQLAHAEATALHSERDIPELAANAPKEKEAVPLTAAVQIPPNEVASPTSSLEFLFLFLKCWRAWPPTWPVHAYLHWMDALAPVKVVSLAALVVEEPEERAGHLCKKNLSCPDDTKLLNDQCEDVQTALYPPLPPRRTIPKEDGGSQEHRRWWTQYLLSRRLWHAWNTTTELCHDRDPIDLAVCWFGMSSASRAPRNSFLPPSSLMTCPLEGFPSCCTASEDSFSSVCCLGHEKEASAEFENIDAIAATCEERLSCACERSFLSLRNLTGTSLGDVASQLKERRPLPKVDQRRRASEGKLSTRQWAPLCLPTLLSHAASRILNPARADALVSSGAPSGGSGAGTPPTHHIHDQLFAALRQAVIEPLPRELTVFQLSMSMRLARWCESTGVHVGWTACRTVVGADFPDAASASAVMGKETSGSGVELCNMPWWVLTVDGLAVPPHADGSADVATLLYLWEQGIAAMAEEDVNGLREVEDSEGIAEYLKAVPSPQERSEFPNQHCSFSGMAMRTSDDSALRPLVSWRALTFACSAWTPSIPVVSATDLTTLETARLDEATAREMPVESAVRRTFGEWLFRYALRLLLFDLTEKQWHQHRVVQSVHPFLQRPRGPTLCEFHRGRGLVESTPHQLVAVGREPASAYPSHSLSDFSHRACVSAKGMKPRFEWHSEAYEPLLRQVVACMVRVIEQLTAELLGKGTALGGQCDMDNNGCQGHRFGSLLRSLHGRQKHHDGDVVVNAAMQRRWTARLSSRFWRLVRCELAHRGGAAAESSFGGSESEQRHQQFYIPDPRAFPETVANLESQLSSLGLAGLGTSQKGVSAAAMGAATASVGDCYALLTALLLSPELLVTSVAALSFADEVLWHTCWTSLVRSTHTTGAANGDTINSRRAWSGANVAELDALVTLRVVLDAMAHTHRLAEELVSYMSSVLTPAVQASSCFTRWLITTPIAAMETAVAHQRASAHHHTSGARRSFSSEKTACLVAKETSYSPSDMIFSPSAVGAFEVLSLGRYREERRLRRVWDNWMRALARENGTLQLYFDTRR